MRKKREHVHLIWWDGWYEHCRRCGACAGDKRNPVTGSKYIFFSDWPEES